MCHLVLSCKRIVIALDFVLFKFHIGENIMTCFYLPCFHVLFLGNQDRIVPVLGDLVGVHVGHRKRKVMLRVVGVEFWLRCASTVVDTEVLGSLARHVHKHRW